MGRKIEYRGKWYSVGDYIELDDSDWFAFQSAKKYQIDFIGIDSCATVIDTGGMRKTIIGNVIIN